MEKSIKHIHFQITRNCNLRCSFCGQWGKKGFFRDASGTEMTFADWEKVISELENKKGINDPLPTVTVWGGEPLVSPDFDPLMRLLKGKGFKTEIITNGVLIDKHAEVIKTKVDKLYVSIDGTKKIHDSVRGKGVFDKVITNLIKLGHPCLTVMSVITEGLVENLPEFLNILNSLDLKELFLQDMIGLRKEQIASYKEWMKADFGITASDIDSWANDGKIDFNKELNEKLSGIAENEYGFKITHKKHINEGVCSSPFSHPHIAWNGNVHYCTDFYDFSAGNVKKDDLYDIFQNETSERFRQAITENKCSACDACSWRIKE